MEPRVVSIEGDGLHAEVSEFGAELVRLRDANGRDLLWDGNPAFWKGRAPLLFPMVGRAVGDEIVIEGRRFPLRQHGFARTSSFAREACGADHRTLTLSASDETRASFPFAFRLAVTYRIVSGALAIEATVFNDDARTMPVSFGFHPAFRWPLPGAAGREDHVLLFDQPETAPIRRLVDGLVSPGPVASPLDGRRLALRDDLFRNDALVFDQPRSRRVAYSAPGAPTIEVSFADMPHLGIWSKPGANFVCIEPWQGFASPQGYDGEFAARPGVVQIAPGGARRFSMTIIIRP